MFKKITRKINGKHPTKYSFEVKIEKVEGIPKEIQMCRVVWSRDAKMLMTEVKAVRNGRAVFNQTLHQVATIYRTTKNEFEPKEYSFKIQIPGKEIQPGNYQLITVAKGTFDMALFVSSDSAHLTQDAVVPLSFKLGSDIVETKCHIQVTATFLTDDFADGMTEISGVTGLTSTALNSPEQDLKGFEATLSSERGHASPGQTPTRPSTDGNHTATTSGGHRRVLSNGGKSQPPNMPKPSTSAIDYSKLLEELVDTKLQLAEVMERETVCRRDLYRALELNRKLASKMTKLEAIVYTKK